MKMDKNKFNVELNLFDYFQYYRYFREKLINKNYDLNSDVWTKNSLLVTKYKDIHLEFKIFINRLLSTPLKDKQRNNHFFLQSLLAEKTDQYLRVSYPTLFKKFKYSKAIKVVEKNIFVKNIYSNKILTNETENILNVKILEDKFIEFIRKQELKK